MNFQKHLIVQKVQECSVHVEYNHTLHLNVIYKNTRNNQHYVMKKIGGHDDEPLHFTDVVLHTHYDLLTGDILIEDMLS